MPSKKSGGQRAVEAKHRARDAKRPKGYAEREAAAFKRLLAKLKRAGASDLAVSAAALRFVMERNGVDPGMPPEYRRQQVAMSAAQLGKVAEPAKVIAEKSALLEKALAHIEALEAKLRGTAKPSGDRGEPSTPPLN